MKHNIYSISSNSNIEEIDINDDDIVLINQNNHGEETKKNLISYSLNKDGFFLNNSLLEILDQILSRYDKGIKYRLVIKGGDFLLNQYLALFVNMIGGEIVYFDLNMPNFPITIDFDELKIFKKYLKKKIEIDEYNKLPSYWKSIYYTGEKSCEISLFGIFLLELSS